MSLMTFNNARRRAAVKKKAEEDNKSDAVKEKSTRTRKTKEVLDKK